MLAKYKQSYNNFALITILLFTPGTNQIINKDIYSLEHW